MCSTFFPPLWCKHYGLPVLAFFILACFCGCGQIADPDNMRVAVVDGNYITRGELLQIQYDKDDTDRIKITSKTGWRRVLNQHIDKQLIIPLGEQLAAEGKVSVSREAARERFFKEAGEDEELYRRMWNWANDPNVESNALMKEYRLTPERIKGFKTIIEEGTDRVTREMLGEAAVSYLAVEANQKGELPVDEEMVRVEYDLRKSEFRQLERLHFFGIRVPADQEGALKMAAKIREDVDLTGSFETVALRVKDIDPKLIFESDIENNSAIERFRGFWETASGAETGQIIGPVYLPEYQTYAAGEDGQVRPVVMWAAYVVLKVLEHSPEREATYEQAKSVLVPEVLYGQMMARLREEHGVKIFEDKLPNPSFAGDGIGAPLLEKK